METIASQITSLTSVYSTVYSGADQSKHQSSASLAFVWGIHRGPVNSPHKWPVTRKMFPFDDVIMMAKPIYVIIMGICVMSRMYVSLMNNGKLFFNGILHYNLNINIHLFWFHKWIFVSQIMACIVPRDYSLYTWLLNMQWISHDTHVLILDRHVPFIRTTVTVGKVGRTDADYI